MSALAAGPAEPHPNPSSGSARQAAAFERGLDICPLLRSGDGSWSSVVASRDLRCWAIQPATQPTLAKQRQLCASPAHEDCSTYRAATSADPAIPPDDVDGTLLWPIGGHVPVALESPHGRAGVAISAPRRGGQALLVALMLVAFVVLVVARSVPPGGSSGAVLAPSASPAASAPVATATPPVTAPPATPDVTPTPSPTGASSSPTPSPSASPRTYRVRSGDTLAMIAGKFNTTVKAIAAANNIVDARTIHPGQVLIIP